MTFNILDRYVGKIVFNNIMATLFMLVSLSSIIKFVDQLRKVGKNGYSAFSAGLYTLLSTPKDIEVLFPMAALLGALLGLGSLASRSELVVMQSSGFSRIQIACSVMKTAIPLVIMTIIIGERISPFGEQMAHNYLSHTIYSSSIISAKNGLWAKDGKDFIFIKCVTGYDRLSGISIYHFDETDHLHYLRYADTAIFSKGVWRLFQVNTLDLSNKKKIIGTKSIYSEWKTNLTPDKLSAVAIKPGSLAITELYQYIKYLKQSGQESCRYQLSMWSKIFSPFSVAVMMLMAISCIFGPLRSVSMGMRVLIGIGLGFLFYVLDQIFKPLSLVHNIPPVWGALLPSITFLIISIILLIRRN